MSGNFKENISTQMCHLGVVEFSESSDQRYNRKNNVGTCCSQWDGGLPQCVQMGETFFSAADVKVAFKLLIIRSRFLLGYLQCGYTQVRQVGQDYQVVVDSTRSCRQPEQWSRCRERKVSGFSARHQSTSIMTESGRDTHQLAQSDWELGHCEARWTP